MNVSNEIAIRNFGWACYNRLTEFVMEVYQKTTADEYVREKVDKAARDPMAWYLDLDEYHRSRAVEIANKYYGGE